MRLARIPLSIRLHGWLQATLTFENSLLLLDRNFSTCLPLKICTIYGIYSCQRMIPRLPFHPLDNLPAITSVLWERILLPDIRPISLPD